MSYQIQQLNDEPIIIITYQEPFDYGKDFDNVKDAIAARVEGIEGKIYEIHDARALQLSFPNLVIALASALLTRGKEYSHKDRLVTIGVGSGPLFDIATKAAAQKQYGERSVHVKTSLEEAIDFAHQEIAKGRVGDSKAVSKHG